MKPATPPIPDSPPPDARGADTRGAAAARVLLALAVAEAALESSVWRGSLWGTHALGFLPGWAWLLLPIVALGFWPRVAGEWGERVAAWSPSPRASALLPPLAGLAAALTFALVRERHLYWGDGLPLSIDIPAGARFHPDEPLTMWLHHALFALGRGAWRAETAIALASAACGGLVVALTLRALLARGSAPGTALLATTVFALQGGMAVFHGHVENYAYVTLCLLAFFWTGLAWMEDRGPLWPAMAALLAGYALHLTGALALPGALLLLAHGLARRERRVETLATAAATAVVAAVAMSAAAGLYAAGGPLARLLDGAMRMLTHPRDTQPAVMLGSRHLLDLVSHITQMGPLSLFVTLGLALVLPSRAWLRTPGGRFALVTALAGYAPALIAGEGNLGAARNWDLFAGPSLVLPVLGLLLVLALPESRPRSRILVAALAASAFVCVPWTALNMDLARTEARVAALPLGHGRGAAMLGTRALNAGDLARAERLFTSALAQDSLNLNAWSGLGLARARAGRWSEALEPLARAAELGAGAPQYRRDLAVLHMRLERWASASADWQQLLSSAPADRAAWFGLAEAQSRLGHADSSAWALAAAAERLPGDAEVSRALADAYARWVATCGVRGDRLGFALAWGTFTRRFPDDPRVSQWRARAEALLAPR